MTTKCNHPWEKLTLCIERGNKMGFMCRSCTTLVALTKKAAEKKQAIYKDQSRVAQAQKQASQGNANPSGCGAI